MALLDPVAPVPAAPAPLEPVAPPVTFRAFDDTEGQRASIYSSAQEAATGKSLENDRYRIDIQNPHYRGDYKPRIADEKQAILEGKTLQRRLHGTVTLTDRQTGQVVDSQDTVLAHVPHLNSRGLFIRDGSTWLSRNQQRLRSGVYARRATDGTFEAQVNARRGRGFHVGLDPQTGIWKLDVGQSTTRLYPVLRALGVSDEALSEAWGPELLKRNYRAPGGNDHKDIQKLLAKLGRPKDLVGDPIENLKGVLARTELDPEVTHATMGEALKTLSPEAIVGISRKVLKLSRGEGQEDNRDSQAYQSVHSAEDFIKERMGRDQAGTLRKMLWRATRQGNLKGLPSGLLTPNIDGLFQGSGLFTGTEDTNPLEIYDLRHGVVRTGEGGISPEAVSRDARAVQSSYLGFIDPNRTPDSGNIGLDLRVTGNTVKGSDNRLYTRLKDPRTGATSYKPAIELEKATVALPGEMERMNRLGKPTLRVRAMQGGQLRYVKRADVTDELPDIGSMYAHTTGTVPMPEGIKGQRLLMGAKMSAQALPLVDAEAPHVQTPTHAQLGNVMGAVRSMKDGVVKSVDKDGIVIQHQDGTETTHDLYHNYAHSRKTMTHNTPVVQVGEKVSGNQLLARSNYTDQQGNFALGKNLRVAYMMAKGATFEDAKVISESAAKKLSSEQLYTTDLDLEGIHSTKKGDFTALYGPTFSKTQYGALDDDGVIKPGAKVMPGDPLVLAVGRKGSRAIGAVMQGGQAGFTNSTQTWDHQAPGEVTDVVRTKGGVKVTVKSYSPTLLSDKLSLRYGNKGVVSKILPDAQMPHDEQGRPVELILNSNAIVSRGNPSTLAEALLGKIAEKTGKPYVLTPASLKAHGGVAEYALNEAKLHGVKELETLTDPETGRKLPNVFVGNSYVMKLHHMAESKLSARDQAAYDVFGAPAKGGQEGAKRISSLDLGALLSHGATEFIKDAKLVRGQRNDAYWRGVRHGDAPQTPHGTFANEHFQKLLTSAGVHIRSKGSRQQLLPLLDSDVDKLASHEIQHAGTFDWETMKPLEGGLFDPKGTGGADGTQWGRISLPVSIPHPMFEAPIVKMLGITRKQLEGVLSGTEPLKGKTGPEAIKSALAGLNVSQEISRLQGIVRTGRATQRDDAVKALGYLSGLKTMGIAPQDLMISRLPVLPPKLRPISRTPKLDITHDLNYLYGDLLDARDTYKSADKTGDHGAAALTLYRAAKAIAGIGDPVGRKSAEQGVKGALAFAIGTGESAKHAIYQRRVLGTPLDTVGRATITAAPELDMDHVRVPPRMAWTMMRPFVVRRLVQNGLPATDAVEAVRNQTATARQALLAEMKVRPVVLNRAPALHRYAYQGLIPILGPEGDDSIGLNYVIAKGLGGDFDGDAVNLHVPVGDKAVKEVYEKLLPSKNLFAANSGEAHLEPQQDYVVGLHLASQIDHSKPVRHFSTAADARAAYRRGEIGLQDPIKILK